MNLGTVLKRIKKVFEMCNESLDLLYTFDPNSKGIKVFGAPNFFGGPETKFGQLSKVAMQRGQPYSKVICLSAVRVPLVVLRILRRRGVKILANQNGVAYPMWHKGDYAKQNRYFLNLSRVAHHVHFQSEFALKSFQKWVGPLPLSYSILANAVDRSVFCINESRSSIAPELVKGLTFVDFKSLNFEQWKVALQAVKTTKNQLPKVAVKWVWMGKVYDQGILDYLESQIARENLGEYIELKINPGRSEVIAVMQSCDFLLHLVHNDVCPNKVLEGLACGLPVIGISSGGTKELVGEAGIIVQVSESYESVVFPSQDHLLTAIADMVQNLEQYKARAKDRSARYDLEKWLFAVQNFTDECASKMRKK